ncbi:MAG: trypsin-like peptidase domain-containing protein [Acidobacteriota bacterium]
MFDMRRLLRSRAGLTFLALLIALTLGILIGSIVSESPFRAAERGPVAQLTLKGEGSPLMLDGEVGPAQGFGKVVDTVSPAVVNIRTEGIIRRNVSPHDRDNLRDFFGNDFWDRFFDQQVPREQKITSLGSGVIVDSAGYVLTNYHVIAKADKISVKLYNGETSRARVLGTDQDSDLAVLKIDAAQPLSFAKVGDSSKLRVGDWVLTMGSPFGFEKSVTAGIVSAIERLVPTGIFGDYIQTDAAINPGNSGGPLVNMRGEVVGINTFITTRSGGSQGVGFAIPSTVFINSYNQLVKTGRIVHGWLGVSMNTYPLTSEMAEFFGVAGRDPDGVKDGDGVVVTQLIDEHGKPAETGPAYRAGVREEDVIVKFGNREVESIWDLRSAVANTPPGERVPLTVVRKGDVKQLTVKLAERTLEDEERANNKGVTLDEREERKRDKEIGIEVRTVSARDLDKLRVEGLHGVIIMNVTPGSLADEAGLRPEQIITDVNGEPVDSGQTFKEKILSLPSGRGIVLRVVTVTPQRQTAIGYTSFVKP